MTRLAARPARLLILLALLAALAAVAALTGHSHALLGMHYFGRHVAHVAAMAGTFYHG